MKAQTQTQHSTSVISQLANEHHPGARRGLIIASSQSEGWLAGWSTLARVDIGRSTNK